MGQSPERILVTGANGFIGTACLDFLHLQNVEVYATTSQSPLKKQYENVTWIHTDLLENQHCKRIIEDIRPTHLLHLAWTAKPGKFWTDPDNLRWLKTSLTLFEAFFEKGGEYGVGLGTCGEYESNHEFCSETETPTTPTTLYGLSKLSCGIGSQASAILFNKKMIWARLFCPYGPTEPRGRFLPDIIDHLLMQKPIACGSGEQIRDFIYIKDVAQILVRLLRAGLSGFINIGSGEPISLRDVATIVIDNLGHPELIQFGERPASIESPQRVVASIDRLSRDLNWSPTYSLRRGIGETIECRAKLLNKQNFI